MTKPGIKRIDIARGGFNTADNVTRAVVIHHTYIDVFDQGDASFNEALKDDENGQYFEQTLDFTVRGESSMAAVLDNIKIPVYVTVTFVDESSVQMGNSDSPVWLETKKNYNGTTLVEVSVSVKNETTDSVLG